MALWTGADLDHRPRFVLVGGVPGAGKTTVLESLAAVRPDATSIDPDRLRRRVAAVLPRRVPYRCYRPLVHLVTTVAVLVVVLRGPTATRRTLLVHDPATRRRRRTWIGHLARRRGWEPVLVLVDVPRATALAGQHSRRRVLGRRAFDRHWQRWQHERPGLLALARDGREDGPWSSVQVLDRRAAHRLLPVLVV